MRAPVLVSLAALLCVVGALAWPLNTSQCSDGPTFKAYAVAADHPLASKAGAEVLEAGGNAADAIAAAMVATGVVSPSSSGLGGGGFALYYRASDKSLTFLDFRERAPGAADPNMFRARADDTEDVAKNRSRVGGLAVGVPGEPAGIEMLVQRFGKLKLSQVVAPAARFAREGFTLGPYTAYAVNMPAAQKDPLIKGWGAAAKAGKPVKNPTLGRTITRFGRKGAALFYKGTVGRQIVKAVKARGGVMTMQDLADYKVVEREPLSAQAFGYRWTTAPPPSAGGYTMLASLELLDRWLPTPAHWKGAQRWHALAESWKGPFLDRQTYFGDPDHVEVPLAELRAADRVKARAARYQPSLAHAPSRYALPLAKPPTRPAVQPDNAGTTHLCAVDAEGNVAAVTTTINLGFGARFNVAGLWLNDEMDDFAREVGKDNAFGLIGGAPNLPAPGKRPVSTMSPTIVFKGDRPVLCVGASGGSRIVTAAQQVAMGVLLDGLHPNLAIRAPRIHHQATPDVLKTTQLDGALQAELTARGHRVEELRSPAIVQAIAIGDDGQLRAGSDPRKGGVPAGK